jgi:hypothetical protein
LKVRVPADSVADEQELAATFAHPIDVDSGTAGIVCKELPGPVVVVDEKHNQPVGVHVNRGRRRKHIPKAAHVLRADVRTALGQLV